MRRNLERLLGPWRPYLPAALASIVVGIASATLGVLWVLTGEPEENWGWLIMFLPPIFALLAAGVVTILKRIFQGRRVQAGAALFRRVVFPSLANRIRGPVRSARERVSGWVGSLVGGFLTRLELLVACQLALAFDLIVAVAWYMEIITGKTDLLVTLLAAPWIGIALVLGLVQRLVGTGAAVGVPVTVQLLTGWRRFTLLALLPVAAWAYYQFKVELVGKFDAAALVTLWAVLAYLWWPRRVHLDVPGSLPIKWWVRLVWHGLLLAGLAVGVARFGWPLFLAALRDGDPVRASIVLMAVELYLLLAWGPRPHPVSWPIAENAVLYLPVPRRLSLPFLAPLIVIEAVILGATAFAIKGLAWSPATALVGLTVGFLVHVWWRNKFPLTDLTWTSVVADMRTRRFIVDTTFLGIGGSKTVAFSKMGRTSRIDPPTAVEDTGQRLLNFAKWEADIIGGLAEAMYLLVRGSGFPDDPSHAEATMKRGTKAIDNFFAYLSQLPPPGGAPARGARR